MGRRSGTYRAPAFDQLAVKGVMLRGGHAVGDRIPRPLLRERIRDALERGSLLVVADAGFGKTLALEGALEDWRTAAWIACSEADRDAGHLLVSLLNAFRRAVPGAVEVLGERLTAGAGTVNPLHAVRELVAELELLLVDPIVVVLDDAETLAGSDGASRLIAELLRSRSRVRLAVASRRELALRTAKLQASGDVTIIRSADLAFTAEECARFLSVRLGREPVSDEVAGALEATAGWPLGLELAASTGEPFASGRAAQRATFEYLAEEVLSAVDAEFRDRVLDSSVPAELSPEVIDSLGLPEHFVGRAQRSGLFLRPLDSDRGVYAYHPLFREFLSEYLRGRRSPAELRCLHSLAARGVASGGQIATSVQHWLAAEEWEAAVAAMAAASPQLLRTSPDSLKGWLERLPADWRGSPTCLLIEGQVIWSAGEHERAIPVLRRALPGHCAAGAVEGEWMARMTLSDALFSTGRFEEMVALAEGWDAFEPRAAPLAAAPTGLFRLVGYAALGRADEVDALIEALLASDTAEILRPLVPIVQAFGDCAAGRTEALLDRFRAGIAELEVSDPTGRLAYLLAGAAMVHVERGEHDLALSCWTRTRDEALRSGLSYVVGVAHAERASLLGMDGKRVEAELELERAGHAAGTGWRDMSFDKAQAIIACHAGAFGSAVAAAEHALSHATRAPLAFRIQTVIELAPVLEASGASGRAMGVVEASLAAVNRQFPGARGAFSRARLFAVRAWLHERAGDSSAAELDVRDCFAEAQGASRDVLRSHWSRLEPIVWRALNRELIDPAIVVREVEAAFPGGAALLSLTRHPLLAVRQVATHAAAASGDPDAIAGLEELAHGAESELATAARSALERLQRGPPALAFTLLGGFSLTRGSWRADDAAWERRVAQKLVHFLLLHRDGFVSEDELLDAFWPERDADSARRSLRVAASRARAVLDLPGTTSVIEIADRMYRLRLRSLDSVDADDFEAAASAALAEHGTARERLLERAAGLWGGEPLPEERYSDWAFGWRERLTDLEAAVLSELSDTCLEHGDLVGAGQRARDLVALDPLNESAHRRLMLTHARAGRRGQALRQYLECRRVLVDELGVEPAAETARLQQRILAGDAV